MVLCIGQYNHQIIREFTMFTMISYIYGITQGLKILVQKYKTPSNLQVCKWTQECETPYSCNLAV